MEHGEFQDQAADFADSNFNRIILVAICILRHPATVASPGKKDRYTKQGAAIMRCSRTSPDNWRESVVHKVEEGK
jgi:hypothetical protein